MKRKTVPNYYETDAFENIRDFSVSCNMVREKYNVHQHEYFELELITEGESVHTLNGEKTNLKKGDVIFVTPMDRHGYESCLIRTVTIHFSLVYLSSMFKNALQNSKNRIIHGTSAIVTKYFEEAFRVFMGNSTHKEIKLKNLVELILLELMPDCFSEKAVFSSASDRVSEAIGYINMNFTNEISLSSIQNRFGISSSYFSHAFRQRTGKTFVNYLAEKRIEYAKTLLLSGEMVIDVCYECGFTGERNFARRFKEFTGMTPKEYQKEQNKSHK